MAMMIVKPMQTYRLVLFLCLSSFDWFQRDVISFPCYLIYFSLDLIYLSFINVLIIVDEILADQSVVSASPNIRSINVIGSSLNPFSFLWVLIIAPPLMVSWVRMIPSISSTVPALPTGSVSSKISSSQPSTPLNLQRKSRTQPDLLAQFSISSLFAFF